MTPNPHLLLKHKRGYFGHIAASSWLWGIKYKYKYKYKYLGLTAVSLYDAISSCWPLSAGAQQPAMPVIGFLSARVAKRGCLMRWQHSIGASRKAATSKVKMW